LSFGASGKASLNHSAFLPAWELSALERNTLNLSQIPATSHADGGYPLWSFRQPWHPQSVQEWFHRFPAGVVRNRGQNGGKIEETEPSKVMLEDARKSGPSQFDQFERLLESMQAVGFRPERSVSDPVCATLLLDERD
jgi:hypothetical protein